jgi:hypothetical protein
MPLKTKLSRGAFMGIVEIVDAGLLELVGSAREKTRRIPRAK